MTTQHFIANGKLLLTGEYFILDGAKALALPTKYGQQLSVESSAEPGIQWQSLDADNKVWFEAQFDQQLEIQSTSDSTIAQTLQSILKQCPVTEFRKKITTHLDFPNNWGLGSSSTLISLIAQYFQTDPYALAAATFGGSGYDIACATANGPITYQKQGEGRSINAVHFNPAFRESLYFLHLGKKQNTREGISHYRALASDKQSAIRQISEITESILNTDQLDDFCRYIELHEDLLAQTLQMPKVKDKYFSDFSGAIKSLGAWGGDFVLVASDAGRDLVHQYFKSKGLPVLISYDAMIL